MIWVHIWIYCICTYISEFTNFPRWYLSVLLWLQNSMCKGELGRGGATKTSTGGLQHHRNSPKRMVPANNDWTWPRILLVKVEYDILLSSRTIHEMHLDSFRYSLVFRVHTQASITRPQAIYALTHLQSSNKIQTETYPPFRNPITTTSGFPYPWKKSRAVLSLPLTFVPSGSFPSLVNCCTIDWCGS